MEPVDQIRAADWVDQDLLTRTDSAELLSQEIAEEKQRLAVLGSSATPDTLAAIQQRIDAMESVRAHMLS